MFQPIGDKISVFLVNRFFACGRFLYSLKISENELFRCFREVQKETRGMRQVNAKFTTQSRFTKFRNNGWKHSFAISSLTYYFLLGRYIHRKLYQHNWRRFCKCIYVFVVHIYLIKTSYLICTITNSNDQFLFGTIQ